MARRAHGYRTSLEVLRDLLKSAREPVPKTRIAGAANLNTISFRRYMGFCLERGLVDSRSGSYAATPRAVAIVELIDRVIEQSSELERTVSSLRLVDTNGGADIWGSGATLRFVSRVAWREFAAKDAARVDASDFASPSALMKNGPPPAHSNALAAGDPRPSTIAPIRGNGGSRSRSTRASRPHRPTVYAK